MLLCQFFVLAGNRFWFYILLSCTQSTIQLWCCVRFFGSGGKLLLVLLTYLVYNTIVWLCQYFCCDGKANLVQIFLLNTNFLLVHRKKTFCYCVPLSCFVWIYNHTVTIVSQKYREFCLISKTILIVFFILEKQLANISNRGFLFLRNTLLLYSLSPYRQTE